MLNISKIKEGFAVTYRTNGKKVAIQSRHSTESNCVLSEDGMTLTHNSYKDTPYNVINIFDNRYSAKRFRDNVVQTMFEKLGFEVVSQADLNK
ncbi:hypothetical protein N9J02_01535 [bacterium]|nr:hypothetical protein [bacterium]